MAKYQAIICDVDGTLLDAEHKLPSTLIELCNELHQQGVIFTLASARPVLSLLQLSAVLGLQVPIIGHNGSLIVDTQHKIWHSRTFAFNELAPLLINYPGILINSYLNFDWYVNYYSPVVAAEEKYVQIKAQIVTEFPAQSHMVVLNASHAQLQLVQQQVQASYAHLTAVFSHPEYLHISGRDVCKGSGVIEFARNFGLSLAEIIAFGDGENDITMLRSVGHGVAMANACWQVQQAAVAVAPSHLEQGVVTYIRQLQAANLIGNE